MQLSYTAARIISVMNETQIICAVLEGDIQAYANLVERYQVGLIIHCDHIVHDRAEAEDIAQKAFIKAYEKLPTFNPHKARFSTWLYRIATNLAIDTLRSHRSYVSLDKLELPAPPDPSIFEAETAAETRQAVAALPSANHRRVIEAYYWEGQSYQEIATDMNVSINTIKSWLHRAKEQLRDKLS
jgi:RNA polymerase sigma-70 factor, ECF subfamily